MCLYLLQDLFVFCFSWQYRLLYIVPIFLFSQVMSLQAETGRTQAYDDNIGAYWFLLPTEDLGLVKGQGRQVRKLFEAPSLDLKTILNQASLHEKNIRIWLVRQQRTLQQRLCRLAPTRIAVHIQALQKEKQRQLLLWKNVHRSYGHSVRAYFDKRQRLRKIDTSLVVIILKAFAVVEEMQDVRQQQVLASWLALIDLWQQDRQEAQKICTNLKKIKFNQPEMMRPYYLAFYRFLSLVPIEERSRFLAHLHFKHSDK